MSFPNDVGKINCLIYGVCIMNSPNNGKCPHNDVNNNEMMVWK